MRYYFFIFTLFIYTGSRAVDQKEAITFNSFDHLNSNDSTEPTALRQTHSDAKNFGFNKVDERSFVSVVNVIDNRVAFNGQLGQSKQGRPIQAFYFPGQSDKKALIIGGVHGSELSAIEIAKHLVKQLQNEMIHYNVVVIPCLFPDNEISAIKVPDGTKQRYNTGRYTSRDAVDPNRQMPAPGSAFRTEYPFDFRGRLIEDENQLLLQLIHQYRPHRVINLHAIRDIKRAGFFADPRTDYEGYALGYETDSSLAISMARYVYENGGNVAGNHLDSTPTTRYHNDPAIVAEGFIQQRNLEGSKLPGDRGQGISLGTWASTAVCDSADVTLNRAAMRLITVEFPGYKRPADYEEASDKMYYKKLLELYTDAIKKIFLSASFEEENTDPCHCKKKTDAGQTFLTDNF
jgi:hypothetical protein